MPVITVFLDGKVGLLKNYKGIANIGIPISLSLPRLHFFPETGFVTAICRIWERERFSQNREMRS